MPEILKNLNTPESEKFTALLERLAKAPPRSLLVEGGSELQRLDMALYWAMLANCEHNIKNGLSEKPCLQCQACMRIAANEHMDLHMLDGRISNTQDQEQPGPVRAMSMENIRNLKTVLATAANGAGRRVVILQGMNSGREESLNALLKILEEPSNQTLFVLLTGQRSQILPTLVSRSLCITLPWLTELSEQTENMDLARNLADFFTNGTGFLNAAAAKGAMDAIKAENLLLMCQMGLVEAFKNNRGTNPLAKVLKPLAQNPEHIALASVWLNDAKKMIQAQVGPVRVLEAVCTGIYNLLRQTQ